jgi:VCPO second helical-bundle domain
MHNLQPRIIAHHRDEFQKRQIDESAHHGCAAMSMKRCCLLTGGTMPRTLNNISPVSGRHTARHWHLCVLLLSALILPLSAHADVVTDWNAIADAVAPRFGAPQQQSRALAIVQIAVHDALNAIAPRYARYTNIGLAQPGASPDAAVAAAARQTLLALLNPVPASTLKQAAIDMIENAYLATVGPAPYDAATQAGIDIGEDAAEAILAARVGDGSDYPHLPYTLLPAPGVYQPTPNPEFPAVITPSFANWAHVTPFVLRSGADFEVEPGAIFNLTSPDYTRAYNEVKQLGDARLRGALPDSEESNIARFWPGGGGNWNANARVIVNGMGLDRWQHARLFGLINLAQADALIANQTWKYTYTFWRPVTAIRWADDGNPDTASDASWRPFLVTPPYPDYPCALPTGTGAQAEAIREFFGTDNVPFTRSVSAPPVPLPAPMTDLPGKVITRSFQSLSEAVEEAQSARVYGGLHFWEGCVAGARQGKQIGHFVVQHALRPLQN